MKLPQVSFNIGFASCGVTVVNSSAVFQFNFSAWLTVLFSEIRHCAKPEIVSGHCNKTTE